MAFVAVIPAVGSVALPALGTALSTGAGALGTGLAGLGGLATSIPGIGGMLGSGLGGLGGGLASLGSGLGGALGALGGGAPFTALGTLGKGLGGTLGSLGAGISGGGLPHFQNMINGVGGSMLPTGLMGSAIPQGSIGAITGDPMGVGGGFNNFIDTVGKIGSAGQKLGLGSKNEERVTEDEVKPRMIMEQPVEQPTITRGLQGVTPIGATSFQTMAAPGGLGAVVPVYPDRISDTNDVAEAAGELSDAIAGAESPTSDQQDSINRLRKAGVLTTGVGGLM